jgi:hypothetical protein
LLPRQTLFAFFEMTSRPSECVLLRHVSMSPYAQRRIRQVGVSLNQAGPPMLPTVAAGQNMRVAFPDWRHRSRTVRLQQRASGTSPAVLLCWSRETQRRLRCRPLQMLAVLSPPKNKNTVRTRTKSRIPLDTYAFGRRSKQPELNHRPPVESGMPLSTNARSSTAFARVESPADGGRRSGASSAEDEARTPQPRR